MKRLIGCSYITIMLLVLPVALLGEDGKDGWAARQIYLENCAACHGFDRMGFIGVPLIPSTLQPLSEAAIRSLIRNGIPDTLMPTWSCRLSLNELRLLSRYFKITRPETEKAIQRGPHGDFQVIERREWWSNPQSIEKGKSLFADYCMGCHHPEYEAFAPAYRNVARQRDTRTIMGQIKFPYTSSRILGYTQQTMPKFDLTDEEIRNLGTYIYQFRTEGK